MKRVGSVAKLVSFIDTNWPTHQDNAVDKRIEGLPHKAQRSDIIQQVLQVAAGPRVRVDATDCHILRAIQCAKLCLPMHMNVQSLQGSGRTLGCSKTAA
jgi:hypothetical protein